MIAAASFVGIGSQEAFPPPTYFVFLVMGKNPPKATKEEISEYQKAHISNFDRLFGLKKLCAAGPMSDPTKHKRGIVMLTVKKPAEVMEAFGPDPYVSKGFMDVQMHPLRVDFGKVNTAGIEPSGIEENRIVIFTKGTLVPDSPELRLATKLQADHLKKEGPKAGLAFYATFTSNTADERAVAFFRGKDDLTIQAWIDAHPLVKMGTLKATKMPQYLGKGVL